MPHVPVGFVVANASDHNGVILAWEAHKENGSLISDKTCAIAVDKFYLVFILVWTAALLSIHHKPDTGP